MIQLKVLGLPLCVIFILFTSINSYANLDSEEISEIRNLIASFSKKTKSPNIGIEFLKSSKELKEFLFDKKTRSNIQMTFGEYKMILHGVKPKPIDPPSQEEFEEIMQVYQERQSRVDQIIEKRQQEAGILASAVPSQAESNFFDRFIRNANKLEEFRKLRIDSHIATANNPECAPTVNDLSTSFKEMVSLRQAIRKGETEFFSIRHDRKKQIATLAVAKRSKEIQDLKIFSDKNELTEEDLKKFDEARSSDKWIVPLKRMMAKVDPWSVSEDDLKRELEEDDSENEAQLLEKNAGQLSLKKSNTEKLDTEEQMDEELSAESSRLVSSTSKGMKPSVSEPEISRSHSRIDSKEETLRQESPREAEGSEVREESNSVDEKSVSTSQEKTEKKVVHQIRKRAPKAFSYRTKSEVIMIRSAPEITDPVQTGRWNIQFSKGGHDGTEELQNLPAKVDRKKKDLYQKVLSELTQTGTLGPDWKNSNFSYFQADSSVGHVHLAGIDKTVVVWKRFKNENRILILYVGKHPNNKDGYNRFLGMKDSNPMLSTYSEIKQ